MNNLIDSGGFSSVFLGVFTDSNKLCAIKVVQKARSLKYKQALECIKNELLILRKLKEEKKFPKFYEMHETVDTFCFVMEYMEGHTLDRFFIKQNQDNKM